MIYSKICKAHKVYKVSGPYKKLTFKMRRLNIFFSSLVCFGFDLNFFRILSCAAVKQIRRTLIVLNVDALWSFHYEPINYKENKIENRMKRRRRCEIKKHVFSHKNLQISLMMMQNEREGRRGGA